MITPKTYNDMTTSMLNDLEQMKSYAPFRNKKREATMKATFDGADLYHELSYYLNELDRQSNDSFYADYFSKFTRRNNGVSMVEHFNDLI